MSQLATLIANQELILEWINNYNLNKKKYPDFEEAVNLTGSEIFPISAQGVNKRLTLSSLQAYMQSLATLFRENTYPDIDDMRTNQNEQTSGRVQFVEDASGDPEIVDGPAYYEYRGFTNQNLSSDYRRLSNEEEEMITGSLGWMIKTVKAKQETYPNFNSVGEGSIWLESSGGKILGIVFDGPYSALIEKYFTGMYTRNNRYAIQLYNSTQESYIEAEITKIEETTTAGTYKITLGELVADSEMNIDDVIQIFLPTLISRSRWRWIEGSEVLKASGNENMVSIEDGDSARFKVLSNNGFPVMLLYGTFDVTLDGGDSQSESSWVVPTFVQ